MKQLTMMWKKQSLKPCKLPELFLIRHYKEGDEREWIDICESGNLGTGCWTSEDFHKKMLGDKGINPEGIFFITKKNGLIVGTATGKLKTEPGEGYLHMVAIHPDFRGFGLAKPLNARAIDYLVENGVNKITLNTDDFRIPAIKVYIWLGFLPVINDTGMEERWLVIMKEIGIQQLMAYTAQGEIIAYG